MVNSDELIGTTEYLTLYARCHINQCHYNWVKLDSNFIFHGNVGSLFWDI